jgi:glutamyl-tRNA reductase
MKLVSLSFHIKDVGVEGLSELNHLFLSAVDSEAPKTITVAMDRIRRDSGAAEMFYLATCNRFELVMVFEGSVPESFALGTSLIPRAFLGKKTVIDHLLGVALSRDSVVFGENQIMGQIKNAFTEQQQNGSVGTTLTRILSLILREAKAIRTELGLSNHHTSVASVAARSTLEFFRADQSIKTRRILLIGAGESNQTFARYLSKRELRDFYWLNRTQARADLMATEIGGQALAWKAFSAIVSGTSQNQNEARNEVGRILPEADIICCATDADALLVNEEVLRQVKPRMVVDISMPSNTDREMIEKQGIAYLGLDDINVAMKLERVRYEEILREMNVHIEESVARLMGELMVHQSGHVLKDSVDRSENLLSQVWEEELPAELQGLSAEQIQSLQKWSQKLVKLLTHTHLETLKVVLKSAKE